MVTKDLHDYSLHNIINREYAQEIIEDVTCVICLLISKDPRNSLINP